MPETSRIGVDSPHIWPTMQRGLSFYGPCDFEWWHHDMDALSTAQSRPWWRHALHSAVSTMMTSRSPQYFGGNPLFSNAHLMRRITFSSLFVWINCRTNNEAVTDLKSYVTHMTSLYWWSLRVLINLHHVVLCNGDQQFTDSPVCRSSQPPWDNDTRSQTTGGLDNQATKVLI